MPISVMMASGASVVMGVCCIVTEGSISMVKNAKNGIGAPLFHGYHGNHPDFSPCKYVS